MIYLDYSATTPVDKQVLDSFVKTSEVYFGNPNSLHELGTEAHRLMEEATKQVADLLKVQPKEVIFTSCASESNNLVLKGIALKYPYRGKHIVTTKLEHSSILETLAFLEKQGFIIDYVPLLENGQIDFEALQKIVTKDTLLVTIAGVSSEVGILQDISRIGKFLKDFPTTFFHVDGTQMVGKVPVNLTNVDLFTCSAHKFYGLKGIGCLIKKQGIELEPLIHGGKSQTIYRSGTPALPLIVSFAKALRLALTDFDEKYQKVKTLNQILLDGLKEIPEVVINSTSSSIPHIVNFSIPKIKSETMLHQLALNEIYISTKTACSKDSSSSLSLLALGKEEAVASTSLRVSISYLTTEEEINKFLKILKASIQKLYFK